MLPTILDLRASGGLVLLVLGLALATGLAVAVRPLDEPVGMTLATTASPAEMGLDTAGREARDEARADLAASHPRLLTYGYPSAAREDYAELLGERLGVTLLPIAGCVVTSEVQVRAEAYNSVIVAHFEARHGPDVFDALWEEATQRHEARRAHAVREADAQDAAMLMLDLLEEEGSALSKLFGEPPSGAPTTESAGDVRPANPDRLAVVPRDQEPVVGGGDGAPRGTR